MEKYATYQVYENKDTGEIKRVPVTEEMEKISSSEWKELDHDPQDKKEE